MIPTRSRNGGRVLFRIEPLLFLLAAALCPVVYAQTDVRFDAFAMPLFALSGDGLAPVLPHGGISAGVGTEIRSGVWIPARLQAGYFHIFPSLMDSAGELYRSWAGWTLSFASGAQVLKALGTRPFSLDLLAGVSFGADHYPGTTVAFASFSVDALARADIARSRRGGLKLLMPLSYIFRPGARSFSAGLGAGWGFAPRALGKPKAGPSEAIAAEAEP